MKKSFLCLKCGYSWFSEKKSPVKCAGCRQDWRLPRQNEKHGLSKSVEYTTWSRAVNRCHNPKNKVYRYYGARGISVCDLWRKSFLIFLKDMGKRPSNKHSLDRINNDGNYEPGNCRWATVLQQARNRHYPIRNSSIDYGNLIIKKGVSRQYRKQLRWLRDGKCTTCGEKAFSVVPEIGKTRFCKKHYEKRRMWARKYHKKLCKK